MKLKIFGNIPSIACTQISWILSPASITGSSNQLFFIIPLGVCSFISSIHLTVYFGLLPLLAPFPPYGTIPYESPFGLITTIQYILIPSPAVLFWEVLIEISHLGQV